VNLAELGTERERRRGGDLHGAGTKISHHHLDWTHILGRSSALRAPLQCGVWTAM